MLSFKAKQGEFIDFGDSELWKEIPHRAAEDLKLYPGNEMLDELIDKVVATQELRHFSGELDVGFKFGTDKAREFWRNEKIALRNNIASEYEDLKAKISMGVFKIKPVSSKSNKIRSFLENVFGAGKFKVRKNTGIVPISEDLQKDRDTETTAATTTSSIKPGVQNLQQRNGKKNNIPSRI